MTDCVTSYFYYPNYESGAVAYNQQKRQAFSIGEFLTFATVGDTSAYAGSILVSRPDFRLEMLD